MVRKSQVGLVSTAVILLIGLLVSQSGPAWAGLPATPIIKSFTASTTAINTGNGSVTLKGDVSNAGTCTISSNHPVAGLPVAVSCSSFHRLVELPPDLSSKTPVIYTFTLKAQASKASTEKSVKVTVRPGKGGYVYPSMISGTESGTDSAYYPFNLSFEFDRVGTCVGTDDCSYDETSISGTGGEYDPPPGTCEQTFSVSQSGDEVSNLTSEFGPDANEIDHLSFQALTAFYYPPPPCATSVDWGLYHSVGGDHFVSNDLWIPGSKTLSATYDDESGSTTGSIDFTFTYG